jgi:hypothetical protein
MRKLMMFVLVLALVFSLSSVMFAEDVDAVPNHGGGKPKPQIPECRIGTVDIKAKVPFYASVEVSKGNLQFNFNEGCYDEQNATLSDNVKFTIKTNWQANVEGKLEGLKHTKRGIDDEIQTTATIRRIQRKGTPNNWMTLSSKGSKTLTKDLPGTGLAGGRGTRNFDATIEAKLGELEDQAMGEYKGKLTLTVLAP